MVGNLAFLLPDGRLRINPDLAQRVPVYVASAVTGSDEDCDDVAPLS